MSIAKRAESYLTGLVLGLSTGVGVATAEVAIVVSPKNPVTVLNTRQVTDIFLGKNSRFPDGSLAVPIDQAEGSPEHDEFYVTVIGKPVAQVKAHWSKIIFTCRGLPPNAVSNNNEVKKISCQQHRRHRLYRQTRYRQQCEGVDDFALIFFHWPGQYPPPSIAYPWAVPPNELAFNFPE